MIMLLAKVITYVQYTEICRNKRMDLWANESKLIRIVKFSEWTNKGQRS